MPSVEVIELLDRLEAQVGKEGAKEAAAPPARFYLLFSYFLYLSQTTTFVQVLLCSFILKLLRFLFLV